MITTEQHIVTTSDSTRVTPDTATFLTIKNSGLVGVKLSINEVADTSNFYTIEAGEILADLSVMGSPTLHFKTATSSSILELIWY